ncbi:hypothetical protein CPB84DRAFT_1838033 [Gymnopilus junonius]|uniref:RRM domain-containing protein n=1 Tax=Gymnopilus junonius TaxID=109634 RepID=A0A9P5TJQ3_GYMJU|nr:hypothetical protein CPB84DRAFT_1838033 [Gymnopilus junonius]
MSSNLGKRKEREEENADTTQLTHGSTLFVSNLPYTATSVDLQTLFSDIAPVRSAFVVTEQGTGVSKGVGYVSFALKEDAEAAYEAISKDGISLVGRKLRVQWADKKLIKEKGEKKELVKKEPKPRLAHQQPRLPQDPLAIRTIIVSGLPPSINSKLLWKKIRKYEGAENVDWPIKNEDGDEDPTTAHVLFNTPGAASDAVSKLHAHVYKGSLLSVTLKKRLDTLAKPVAVSKASSNDTKGKAAASAAPSHASRLIVRNIPFNATEQDLRAIFLPYGPIYSIHIPTEEPKLPETNKEDEAESSATAAAYAKRQTRTKGFAFVWMLSKKDAERAIEGCNGMVVRAGTAQELISDKQKRKKQKRLEKKAAAAAAAGRKKEDAGEDEEEEQSDEEEDEDIEKEENNEADDKRAWSGKNKWEEEKAKIQEDDVEMGDASGSSDSDSEEEDREEKFGVHSGSDEDDSDDSDSQPGSSEDEDDNGHARSLFRAFGPLRYARITLDPATGRSRGTGFACFWNLEDANRVVQQSDLLRIETTGGQPSAAPKKNPFSLPSILTPDPSSSLAQSLVLHGRTLDVVRAVTRDVAGKLKEDGERAREKADKRNMYLLREGVILPNAPAAENLSPAEIERRTSSFNARRALLKSNPSLYISKTRLSVRQIPIFVTERMLKRLVKQGSRTPLTADEIASDKAEAKPDDVAVAAKIDEDKKKKGKKFMGRDTGVKQTKIVRQAERVDPITGKGRSKGYGFIEMHRHTDALPERAKEESERDDARIKRLKEEIAREENKEETGQGGKKSKGSLIVEFSIENVQVVQRRTAIQKEQHNKAAASSSTESPLKRSRKASKDDQSKSEEPSSKKRRVSSEDKSKTKAKSEPVEDAQAKSKFPTLWVPLSEGNARSARQGRRAASDGCIVLG